MIQIEKFKNMWIAFKPNNYCCCSRRDILFGTIKLSDFMIYLKEYLEENSGANSE